MQRLQFRFAWHPKPRNSTVEAFIERLFQLPQVSEMLDLAGQQLPFAASKLLPTVLLVSFSAFSPSLTNVLKDSPARHCRSQR